MREKALFQRCPRRPRSRRQTRRGALDRNGGRGWGGGGGPIGPRSPDAPGRSRPLPLPAAAALATAAAGSSCAQLVPGGPGESVAVGGPGWAGRWPEPPSGRGGRDRGVGGKGGGRSAGPSLRLPGEWRHCLPLPSG